MDYARCLAHFLDELDVVRAHVLGLSWGGILAQEFYRMYPQRLRCLAGRHVCRLEGITS